MLALLNRPLLNICFVVWTLSLSEEEECVLSLSLTLRFLLADVVVPGRGAKSLEVAAD
jgi:hypothetical protein